MTASQLPARLLTARGLADSAEFRDGTWRDGEGLDLFDALEAALGSHEAAKALWREASYLVPDLYDTPRGPRQRTGTPS